VGPAGRPPAQRRSCRHPPPPSSADPAPALGRSPTGDDSQPRRPEPRSGRADRLPGRWQRRRGCRGEDRRRSRRRWRRSAWSSPWLLSVVGLVVSAWRTPRGASVTGHNRRVGLAAHQASKAVGQVDAGTTADSSSPRQPGWAPEPFWVMPECRTPKPDSDPPWTAPEDSQKTHRTVRLHWWRTDRNARLAWQRLRSFYVCQLWEALEVAGVRWPRRRLATERLCGSCCWDGGRGRVPGPAGGRGPAG
jgi:hypothetical protein